MRTLSFIFAFALVFVGPSLAHVSDGALPGIGTFYYNGAPLVTDAPLPIVMASR